jgi:hypothetical protein
MTGARRAPAIWDEHDQTGWSLDGALEFVRAMIDDAADGHAIDADAADGQMLLATLVEAATDRAAEGRFRPWVVRSLVLLRDVVELLCAGCDPESMREYVTALDIGIRGGLVRAGLFDDGPRPGWRTRARR